MRHEKKTGDNLQTEYGERCMKILIVSDTHRKNDNYLKALEVTAPVDMVIHCGDIEGSEYLLAQAANIKSGLPTGITTVFPWETNI